MENDNDPSGQRSSGSGPRPLPKPDSAPRSRYGAGDFIAEKYRLGRRLGEGGMGEVWLAHNETLDIDVAIKLIRSETGGSPEQADRLLNEARAAARLGHPAIVRINDFGKTGRGDPFIVMELLEGEDLADALANRGRLSATKAVRTILPIAHALTAAHTKGIVHRDLKPENIFLAQNDDGQIQPKLVDFGVAKLEAQRSTRLTQTGALLGSPLYMSPEQARGDDVDHRADIWALGVVLYEMLTGRPPFEGKNYNAVLYSIIANPPTPIGDLAVGDDDLWTILERALQKDPDRRWYSMRDFGESLAMWLTDKGIHEDIAGGSLPTTWLNWNRDESDLGSGPPPPNRGDRSSGVEIPPPPTLPGRARQDTLRRKRQTPRTPPQYIAIAASAALILGIAIASWLKEDTPKAPASTAVKTSEQRSDERAAPKPAAMETGASLENVAPPAAEEVVLEPSIDPSALPVAVDDGDRPRAARTPKADRRPRPPPNSVITTRDPYGPPGTAPPRSALKDPFK